MTFHNQPKPLSVQVIADLQPFSDLKSDWDRVCCGLPFRTFAWHFNWWRHFGSGRSLLILAVYDSKQCIGIAPFCIERSLSVGRVVQFMGSGEVASDQQSILSVSGRCDEVATALANWFAGQHGAGSADLPNSHTAVDAGDLLELDGMDAICPTIRAFVDRLEQHRYTVLDRSTVSTWRIALPSSTDAYLAMLSKPCRRKVRTAFKQFEANELAVSIADSEAAFENNWTQFTQLHQRRRQSLGEAGCFANETFSCFLYDVARQFHQAGLLDLVCISADNRPIAAEICFRDQSSSFAYQIGIDPDALGHSPGWLVNAASIRRAIGLGLSSFDLCRGDAEYKRHLGADPTTCKKLRIVPPRLRSQVLNTAMTTGAAMKHWCQDMFTGTTTRS
jgi:CelD/BcsL family acetyltransferase involved in cellulose biosynthesis